jgi:hypothetical protein
MQEAPPVRLARLAELERREMAPAVLGLGIVGASHTNDLRIVPAAAIAAQRIGGAAGRVAPDLDRRIVVEQEIAVPTAGRRLDGEARRRISGQVVNHDRAPGLDLSIAPRPLVDVHRNVHIAMLPGQHVDLGEQGAELARVVGEPGLEKAAVRDRPDRRRSRSARSSH